MATKSKAKGVSAQEAFNELEQQKQIKGVKTAKPFNFQDYQISQQPTPRTIKLV